MKTITRTLTAIVMLVAMRLIFYLSNITGFAIILVFVAPLLFLPLLKYKDDKNYHNAVKEALCSCFIATVCHVWLMTYVYTDDTKNTFTMLLLWFGIYVAIFDKK